MKTALVIGASRGIGRAIALRLAADGFDIFASVRKPEEFLAGPAREIQALGRTVTTLVFDVSDRDAVQREYAKYFSESAPDVIVYNAGIARDDVFALMTPEEWDDVIHTNLDGFFNTVQPLTGNMMLQKHGRIVAVTSISGQIGQMGQANYAASKAGIAAAVKSLARELGRKNILVNAVAPGLIETAMTEHLPKEQLLPLIPVRRFGKPEEVAAAVSFLCGPDSSYISGQVLSVSGGMVM